MTPDGRSSAVRVFTPTLVSGDKSRLTADGNRLEVFQEWYLADSRTRPMVPIPRAMWGFHTFTQAFTFTGWEGGDIAGAPHRELSRPHDQTSFSPATGFAGDLVMITGTNFTGATAVSFNGTEAPFPSELRDDDLCPCADQRHDWAAERHDVWRHRGRRREQLLCRSHSRPN